MITRRESFISLSAASLFAAASAAGAQDASARSTTAAALSELKDLDFAAEQLVPVSFYVRLLAEVRPDQAQPAFATLATVQSVAREYARSDLAVAVAVQPTLAEWFDRFREEFETILNEAGIVANSPAANLIEVAIAKSILVTAEQGQPDLEELGFCIFPFCFKRE